MPTKNVSLTKALSEFVEHEVSLGEYGSASEVVRDGLRLLRREKALAAERRAILQREVEVGVEQARAGRLSKRSIADISADVASQRAR
jgi:antitoxin ParD1/3/4